MVPRRLGRSGLRVSPLGLGTTKLGRNTAVKYRAPFTLPSDDRVRELLATSLELGVNLIDTAPAYGESERRIGKFLATYRQHFVLSTKCGEQHEDGYSTYDFSMPTIMASVEESLRRLQTDSIEILLLHSDGRDVEILTQTDALEALSRLKRSGKIRAAGISAKTAAGVLAARETVDVVMAPFSERDSSLGEALRQAHDADLGVMAIKGLFSGYLEPRPAIEFVLRQPFVDTLILGTIEPAHLCEAVVIADSIGVA
jgi:aryl-alcohol dehydrogenase-like predicted oxidoreductase